MAAAAAKSSSGSTKRKGGSSSSKSNNFHKKQKVDKSKKDNNNNNNNNQKDLSNSALKRQARKERQAQRRHADTVSEAKTLWNKIRVKTNTPDETKELMERIMTLIRGKVNEIALQHDASRVVQAAVQFGTDEQRQELLKEICVSEDSLIELSKIQYAHFCCLKFIKYCSRIPDCVKLIVKSFKGSIPKLAVHSVGARVVESLFLNFPPSATIKLKQEFYGPHYNLFAADLEGVPTLKSVVESAKTDTQKESALKFVKDIVNKGITKSFFGYKYFQDILAEYLDVAEPNEIRSTIASSLVDHSIHLLSTRAGSKVVAKCASYATPKDRKRICKSLKGYTRSSLLHRDAYIAILRLVQVTDDTVSIHKSILNELLTAATSSDENEQQSAPSPLLDLALSETASKLFILLLLEDDEKRNKYFDPYEQSILCVESFVTENGKKVPTSKKDPAVRRKELLQHMTKELNNLCITHSYGLLRSLPGARVVKEVYENNKNAELVESLVKNCEASLEGNDKSDDDDDEGESFTLFEDPVGHRAVKNIFLCDASSEEPAFSKAFVDRLGDRLMDVAKSNRGAYVVAALLKVPTVKKQVQKQLNKKELKKLSSGKGVTSGFKALLTEMA